MSRLRSGLWIGTGIALALGGWGKAPALWPLWGVGAALLIGAGALRIFFAGRERDGLETLRREAEGREAERRAASRRKRK